MIETKFKNTEVGLIPEDWEVNKITELCTLNARIGWQGLRSDEYLNHGDYLLITGTDFQDGFINWRTCCYVTEWRFNQDKKIQIKDRDILISKDGTIGKVAFVENPPKQGTLNSGIFVVRPKSEKGLDQSYLSLYFKSHWFKEFIEQLTAGSTIVHLYQKDFIKFDIIYPSNIEEQKKIGNAIGAIDNLLTSLDKQIAKKRLIKQGAMQQLLTGKTRLAGFSQPWIEKKLGDIAKVTRGQSLQSRDFVNGNVPVIAGGMQPAGYHNKANRTGKNITISASGANAGYVALYTTPIFASDCSTIGESKEYCIEFIYYNLSLIQDEIYQAQTGGAQPHVHPSDIEPIVFHFPSEIAEQTAIANILSDMDAEISALEAKRDKYQKIKQGMMNQLLTGKIRLV